MAGKFSVCVCASAKYNMRRTSLKLEVREGTSREVYAPLARWHLKQPIASGS